MVTMSASMRNLTQVSVAATPRHAVRVDPGTALAAPGSSAASAAVSALSDLLSDAGEDPRVLSRGEAVDKYETYGHPDLLAELWALVVRPVGKGLKTTTRTVTVEGPNGPMDVQVSESTYYNRPLTQDELLYLAEQARLKNRKVRPSDARWLTHPELR
jgi:hypothetical protein